MRIKPWMWFAGAVGAFILLKDDIAQATPFLKVDISTPGKTVLLNKVGSQYEISGHVIPANSPTRSFLGKLTELNGNTAVALIKDGLFTIVFTPLVGSVTLTVGQTIGDDDPILTITRIREV